ncbi:hypothetical protein PIB30_055857 [Stylosanthes scabra]|uniref:Uncharacterized protein n=1 Tax=Stylosanthes scabra TaxID=79078 RepID=A0ABU6SJ28_9FABA|nr:hypothetical protein [Stylosanthes scabra]
MSECCGNTEATRTALLGTFRIPYADLKIGEDPVTLASISGAIVKKVALRRRFILDHSPLASQIGVIRVETSDPWLAPTSPIHYKGTIPIINRIRSQVMNPVRLHCPIPANRTKPA